MLLIKEGVEIQLPPLYPQFGEVLVSLFDDTEKLIIKLNEELKGIPLSTFNESMLVYLYRLFEKELKSILRYFSIEDDYINKQLGNKINNYLYLKDYIKFIRKIAGDDCFEKESKIQFILGELSDIRNAVIHGEALSKYDKTLKKLEKQKKVFLTSDGYFHPQLKYLIDTSVVLKTTLSECFVLVKANYKNIMVL